jgi:hypothetical protein
VQSGMPQQRDRTVQGDQPACGQLVQSGGHGANRNVAASDAGGRAASKLAYLTWDDQAGSAQISECPACSEFIFTKP